MNACPQHSLAGMGRNMVQVKVQVRVGVGMHPEVSSAIPCRETSHPKYIYEFRHALVSFVDCLSGSVTSKFICIITMANFDACTYKTRTCDLFRFALLFRTSFFSLYVHFHASFSYSVIARLSSAM